MKNFFPSSWARTCAFLVGTILSASALKAQLPTSVDIDLVPGSVTNTMDVKLRSNGASFAEVLSTLTFTIRYRNQDGTLSPATLGGANTTAFCPTDDIQTAIPPRGFGIRLPMRHISTALTMASVPLSYRPLMRGDGCLDQACYS